MGTSRNPPAVVAYVSLLGLLAALAVLGAAWSIESVTTDLLVRLGLGAVAVWSIQSSMRLRQFRKGRSEVYSYEEVLFPVLLVIAGPAPTVMAFFIAVAIVNIQINRSLIRIAFNVSQFTVSAAVGAATAAAIGVSADGRGVAAVLLAAVVFAVISTVCFGILRSLLGAESTPAAIATDLRQASTVLIVQVLLGTLAAVAILAVPAVAPVALVTIVAVLWAHGRWYRMARDREQVEDLLRATVDLHGSLSIDQVDVRLVDAIFTLIGAEAQIVRGDAVPAPDTNLFPIDSWDADRTLVVRRQAQLDATAKSICETLARIAGVSYRMASLLEEREKQAVALQEIIAEREAFLATTAHRLRTPLTAVVGFSSLMWQDDEESSANRELMEMLVGQATEMSHHLDNLLVSSRALTDSVMIAPAAVDIGAEARRAVTTAGLPDARLVLPPDPVSAHLDPVRLRQILRNLLFNAASYGGDQIEVRVQSDAGSIRIEVADNGWGIDSAVEPRMFESPHSHHRQGGDVTDSGLGLYVGRLLAQLMGGDLSYAREGDWSIFRLEFHFDEESALDP